MGKIAEKILKKNEKKEEIKEKTEIVEKIKNIFGKIWKTEIRGNLNLDSENFFLGDFSKNNLQFEIAAKMENGEITAEIGCFEYEDSQKIFIKFHKNDLENFDELKNRFEKNLNNFFLRENF